MKKNIRKIGILMITFSLMACTKEVDVLEPTLEGIYKYKRAGVSIPVAVGNSNFYGDLTLIPGKECLWDNNWEFAEGKAILREGQTFCGDKYQELSKNDVIGNYEYIYDKDNQTIKLLYEGKVTEIWKDVKLGYSYDNKLTLSFNLWDEDLKQVVAYYMEAE